MTKRTDTKPIKPAVKAVPVVPVPVPVAPVPEPEPPIEKLFVRQIAEAPAMWQAFCKAHWPAFESLTLEGRMTHIVRLASHDVREDDEQGRAILRAL